MSGLIDIWTSEIKKLHSDNKTDDTHGSNPSKPESANQVRQYSIWSQALLNRVNSVPLSFPTCSEASVAMLIDSFSA
ncbi:hypothetical protein Hanom_Chr04g00379251 [Helianthus anomalus]